MAIAAGTRFGPYEIGDALGAGGMGEVYRATDTVLQRQVAVKVLPATFASDAGRIARFEQEAKNLAALNHPNIAQIYGLEKSGDTTALVMELIEGPTLADRIAGGPIPADEALNVAFQIADALEAAHGHGIVHRDLKPANIKLKPDGTVKVLDFGIAKALAADTGTGAQSPIMTTPVTQIGVILGTAAYMSPEQARGKAVDQRADIWAFGCLLYEMLTGQLAFAGEDVAVIMARVIANETDMSSIPAAVSPAVRHTIALCLEKNPAKRIADIRDVRLALQGRFETEIAIRGAADRQPLWRRSLAPGVALVAGLAIAAVAAWTRWPAPEVRPATRFEIVLTAEQVLRNTGRPVIDLSRDGRSIVVNTELGLILRRLDDLEPHVIPGTEISLAGAFFSADGQSLGYYNFEGALQRTGTAGSAPVTIARGLTDNLFGTDWTDDGWIFYGQPDGIYRVPATGGAAERVVDIDNGSGQAVYFSELLPDGDSLLFSVTAGNWDAADIFVQSLTTGERKMVLSGGDDARYLPTGHIVYAFENGLFAVPFDLATLSVTGGSVPLISGLLRGTLTGAGNYAIGNDGTLVYITGENNFAFNELVWVHRDGREEPFAGLQTAQHNNPRISPDGRRLAITISGSGESGEGGQDIWVYDLVRPGAPDRLTFHPGFDMRAIWSPDSQRLTYYSSRDGGSLLTRAADGTGTERKILSTNGRQLLPEAMLPDESAVIVRTEFVSDRSLYLVTANEDPVPLLDSPHDQAFSDLSPDGRWLAYTSDETGSYEIYVRSFPDVDDTRVKITTSGGVEPLWSPDGRELFYLNGNTAYAVPIEGDTAISVGEPVAIFSGNYYVADAARPNWDIHPDGDRFLMIRNPAPTDLAGGTRIVVVENWLDELKRLAPTD
jgi:Tol biopolymer transport system component